MVNVMCSEQCVVLNNIMQMRHLIIKNDFDLAFMSHSCHFEAVRLLQSTLS